MNGADGQFGCRLPEDLRRYYLETMGVSVWQEQGRDDELVARSQEQLTDEVVAESSTGEGWSSLEREVAACTRCEELCDARTQTVFGVGDRDADILVIGEAPGREEDQQGEPFVGRAGQLLNAMLRAIGIERKEVFIANILKCRPPDNRDPRPEEITNCQGFLQRQVELIQPRAILVVGRIAAQSLLETDTPIGKMRGSVREYRGVPVFVTYHPAYLLRQPGEKRKVWQDLLMLKGAIDSWR